MNLRTRFVSLTRRSIRGGTDDGLSLIEVLVAMLIFAGMSVGVAYSLVMALSISGDSIGRQTAANVAASAVDRIRSIADFSDVGPSSYTQTVNGRDFYVKVSTNLVGATTGTNSQCTSGSGVPVYKSVNVDVTWKGMSKAAQPVQADTAIAPSARLNDPALGVIVASVKTASGAGNQGVTVKAVPAAVPNGAKAITGTIDPTDIQGCSVIFGVTPGNYVVSISEAMTGNPAIDSNQSTAPSFPVSVSAGGSSTAPFQFDQASSFTLTYAGNYTGGPVNIPTGMQTSFTNTYATWTRSAAPFYLHPYTSGYSVIAGTMAADGSTAANCLSVDPGQWPLSADKTVAGVRSAAAATAPGGLAAVAVPMGVVQIDTTLLSGTSLKIVAQTTGPAGTDDPGCASPSTYTISTSLLGGSKIIALPFGSWAFYTGGGTTQLQKGVTVLTRGVVTQVSGNSIATLDPRTPVTP